MGGLGGVGDFTPDSGRLTQNQIHHPTNASISSSTIPSKTYFVIWLLGDSSLEWGKTEPNHEVVVMVSPDWEITVISLGLLVEPVIIVTASSCVEEDIGIELVGG